MSSSFPTSIRAFTRLCDVLPWYGLKVSVTRDLSPQVCAKFCTLGLLLGSSFLLDRIPGNSHLNEIEIPVHLVRRKTSEQRATISLAMGIEMFQRIFTQWFSRTTTHHHINPVNWTISPSSLQTSNIFPAVSMWLHNPFLHGGGCFGRFPQHHPSEPDHHSTRRGHCRRYRACISGLAACFHTNH